MRARANCLVSRARWPLLGIVATLAGCGDDRVDTTKDGDGGAQDADAPLRDAASRPDAALNDAAHRDVAPEAPVTDAATADAQDGAAACPPDGSCACPPAPAYCHIGGTCRARGERDPDNDCRQCDPRAPDAWSAVPRGTQCRHRNHCYEDFQCDGAARCNGVRLITPPVPLPARPVAGEPTGSVRSPDTAAPLRPTFTWSIPDDDCGAPTFALQVDDSCPAVDFASCTFSSPVIDAVVLGATSYRPSADLAVDRAPPVGRRYFWRVRACRGAACSAWSSTRYVDVGRAPHDFNGDGYADLAVGSKTSEGLFVYHGSAAGLPSDPQLHATVLMRRGTTGDLNGDGFDDLVGSARHWNTPTRLYVFYGSARGLPATPLEIEVPLAWSDLEVYAQADYDGDGADDLVTASADLTLAWVFKGSAIGIPRAQSYFIPNLEPGPSRTARRMRAGDFNADGLPDLAVTSGFMERVDVFAGSAAGLGQSPNDTIFGMTNATDQHQQIAVTDLDGDARADLVLGMPASSRRATGSLFAFTAGGAWFPETPTSTFSTAGPTSDLFGADVATGRLFRDHGANAIAVNAPGAGKVYLFRATLPLASSVELAPPSGAASSFENTLQVPGDFDADGTDDLVVSHGAPQNGVVYVYFGPVSTATTPLVIGLPDDFGSLLY